MKLFPVVHSLLVAVAMAVAVCLALLGSRPAVAGPFSAGTLVIERLGDGATALSGSSAQISVLEVTTAGSISQTITFDTSGANQQSDSGSATSNGYLNTYFSGTLGYVSVTGYNNPVGTATVTSQNTKVNATLDASGSVINRTLFPTGGPTGTPPSPFSGNNFRSSIATSGSTFYAAGTASGSPSTGGLWFYNGAAFTQVSSTAATVSVTNIRNVEIYNNQLYFSSASGTFLGVSSLGSGLPTTTGQLPALQINIGAGGSPYGFVMFSTGSLGAGVLDLAYVADDRATTGGGLQKWTYNGTSWSNQWSLLVSGSTNGLAPTTTTGYAGLRGLAGTWDATNGATLYATTAVGLASSGSSNNALISIVDGGATPSSYTTLLTSGTNYVFRGVDVSPASVPEPSALALAGLGVAAAGFAARRRCRPA